MKKSLNCKIIYSEPENQVVLIDVIEIGPHAYLTLNMPGDECKKFVSGQIVRAELTFL